MKRVYVTCPHPACGRHHAAPECRMAEDVARAKAALDAKAADAARRAEATARAGVAGLIGYDKRRNPPGKVIRASDRYYQVDAWGSLRKLPPPPGSPA